MIHPSASVHPTAFVFPDSIVGENCRIGAGAKIGTLGLTIEWPEARRGKRKPAKGIVILEEGVDVGANTIIHRGDDGNTIIRKGTFIGSMCNIAHDVETGEYCQIGPMSFLGGRVKLGNYVRIAPGAIINNRIKIEDNAVVLNIDDVVGLGDGSFAGLGSLVLDDVPPGVTVVGRPAMRIQDFRKTRKALKKLVEMVLDGRLC